MDPLGYVVAGLICAVVARVVVTGRGLSTPRAPDTDAMATRFAGVTHPTWHLPTVAAGSLVAMDLPTASGACVQRAEMVAYGMPAGHQRHHPGASGAPDRWRVIADEAGGVLPVGTHLRLEGVNNEVVMDNGGFAAARWLFTTLDGPSAGTLSYARTYGDPYHEIVDPSPACLKPEH